jgi:hypothetical protein
MKLIEANNHDLEKQIEKFESSFWIGWSNNGDTMIYSLPCIFMQWVYLVFKKKLMQKFPKLFEFF